MHLLDPQYPSWDALLLNAATNVVRAEREGGLAEPWSTWNITAYRHPLSAGLPFVGRWLDMPCSRCSAISTPQHALERVGLVGADDRVSRSRKRRDHAHADRPERPPTLTVLLELTSGMGQWRTDAISARTNGLYVDAHAVNLRLKMVTIFDR